MADIKKIYDNLDKIDYSKLDLVEILGNREYPEFDEKWVRTYMKLLHLKKEKNYPKGRMQISETYKKRSFEKIIKLCGDMGLAMQVSSDMELMYDGLALKYDDPWFLKLVACYERGEIPTGDLELVEVEDSLC